MDHHHLVTAKSRMRNHTPQTSLRQIQMIEDLYGETNIKFDATQVLAMNNIFSPDVYFPLQGTNKYIKK
jgi:hypothetical protein